ncbi:D-amino-acid dehydrogenase [Marmoricola sp. URHA0025 HA25]
MRNQPVAEHVLIVGAGVIGLCAAHYLERAGVEVTVIDKEIGGGAARGNAGLIGATAATPLPAPGVVSDALRHLFDSRSAFVVSPTAAPRLAPFLLMVALHSTKARFEAGLARLDLLSERTYVLWDELVDQGIGTSQRSDGWMKCFDSVASAHREMTVMRELADRGIGTLPPDQLWVGDALREHEPAVGPAVAAGYVHPAERCADPSEFVDQIHQSLEKRGVRFVLGSHAQKVGEGTSSAWVELDLGERLEADHVLVAAGARSTALVRPLESRLRVIPGKGYSLSVQATPMPRHPLYFHDAHIVATPMVRGLRVAGILEFDGTFDRFNRRRIAAIAAIAGQRLSSVDWSTRSEEWVGARPMTPDGVPFIGPVSSDGRVLVATGHNMLGFGLAPATGELVADLLTGRRSRDRELRAFGPQRRRRMRRRP